MKYTKTLLAIAAMSALTMSCSDEEYFDKAAYDKLITEAFPVSDVDPDHDWQTISAIDVNVTLAQSGEGESTLRIYDGYPTDSTAYLLATTTMENGETYSTTVNCGASTEYLYIAVTDPEGYTDIYTRQISDKSLVTTVGNQQTIVRSRTTATRATIQSYNFEDNISDSEYNASVPSNAISLSDIENTSASAYYVDNGQSQTAMDISLDLGQKTNFDVYILKGKYNLKKFSLYGNITIHLLEGAEVTCSNSNLTFGSGSGNRMIISSGASLIFAEKSLKLDKGFKLYNRGTFKASGMEISDCAGTLFFNDESGVVTLGEKLTLSQTGVQYINYGTTTVPTVNCMGYIYNNGQFTVSTKTDINYSGVWINENYYHSKEFQAVNGAASKIYNKCKLVVDATLTLNYNTMTVDGGGSIKATDVIIEQQATLDLGSSVLVDVSNMTKLSGWHAKIQGSGNSYALIKTSKLNSNGENYLSGNLAICYESDNDFNVGQYATNIDTNVKRSKGLNSQNITIAASNCSNGYSAGTAMDTGGMSTNSTKLRYCYEDNFPSAGDYDFNDCVIGITPTQVSSKKVTYKVDLVAVGATKQIAAAMRLKGINTSNISNVTITGDLYDLNKTTSSINSDLIKQKFTSAYTSSTSGEAVIYLFNDAHYAFLNSTSSTGSVSRPFINTVKDPETIVETLEAAPISCEITVEFNSEVASTAVGENCIDPFIVTEYNGGKWEIHTHEWQTSPALYDYNVSSQYDINLPWALCLPSSFKYPKEWTSIGSDKDGVTSGAYTTDGNSFAGWCKKKTTNMDWYKYANSDLVY